MARRACLLMGALALVLAGCSAASAPQVGPTGRPASIAGTSVSSQPAPPGFPAHVGLVAATGLRTIDAVNSRLLVGLWSSGGRGWLARSVDGGSTWRAVGTSLPVTIRAYPIASIAFVSSRHGALFVSGELVTTDDGGASWSKVELSGRALDLSSVDGVAWALGESCSLGRCALAIATDDLQDASGWVRWPVPFAVAPDAEPILAQSGPRTGLLVASRNDPDQPVYMTSDGGRRWQAAGSPCAVKTPVRVHRHTIETQWESLDGLASAASSGSREWWAVCGGGAAAGTVAKGLESSSDDGRTWSQIAAFPSIAPYVNPEDLPAGDFGGLTAAPTGRLVMTTPNGVGVSTDRGRSWQGVQGVNLGGTWASVTTDARGAVWVLAPGVGLWRSDGELKTLERL